jgi:hypothetical protein
MKNDHVNDVMVHLYIWDISYNMIETLNFRDEQA